MSGRCIVCGKELEYNEIGATRRFVNRGSTEFLCYTCLAKRLGTTEAFLKEKIEHFRRQGCRLFV